MSSVANASTKISATLFVSIGRDFLGKFSLTLVWVMAMSGVYKHYNVFMHILLFINYWLILGNKQNEEKYMNEISPDVLKKLQPFYDRV